MKATVIIEIEASNGSTFKLQFEEVYSLAQDNPRRWAFDSDSVVAKAATKVHDGIVGTFGSVTKEQYGR
jgi:hypothetical protein